MSIATCVNSVGLLCDIVGTVLVWRFGLPQPLDRSGAIHLILEQADEAERAKAARYDRFAGVGIGLLLIGFSLQLASNFLRTKA